MEKQRYTKGRKRRRRRAAAAAVDDSKEDRISKLPESILHHILCFLDQRDAATTSVLSKPWRYLWCTRPQIDFCYSITAGAGGNEEAFFSVLDRTLQGYHDRKLCLQEITLRMPPSSDETNSFLQKWIRRLVQSMAANKFHLHFRMNHSPSNNIWISSSTFRSESLQNLSLRRCALRLTPSAEAPPLQLKHLKILALTYVDIPEEILDVILSNCRFLEHVYFARCTGFKRIKLKPPSANLKEFCFYGSWEDATSIAMSDGDIPTLRRIEIDDCLLSVNRDHRFYFSHLTSLMMKNVTLSSDLFSCDLPCLEELSLYDCSSIKEFNLSSPSMKRMEIFNTRSPFKVTVDAPSIVSFRYEGILPQSISFSAAPTSCKSYIDLTIFGNESSLCFKDLIGLLEALSQSEISINLGETMVGWLRNQLSFMNDVADLPVVVDHLIFERISSPFASDFLKRLFLMLRPRFIYTSDSKITKALTKTLQVKEIILDQRKMARNFLRRFSDGVSMQVFYRNGGTWQPFRPIGLSKLLSKKGESMDQTFLPIDMESKIKLLIFK